ncbi:MAG: hypothetical protein AAF721_28965, partial [Myxococcota bacterium]
YITALVTVSPMEAIDWAAANGQLEDAAVADRLRAALLENPLSAPEGLAPVLRKVTEADEVRRRVVAAVRRGNQRLARVERIKRIVLLERELSVADDELTPTMKVRRKTVEGKFTESFDRLYTDESYGIQIESR